jgi:hypothetical protein
MGMEADSDMFSEFYALIVVSLDHRCTIIFLITVRVELMVGI